MPVCIWGPLPSKATADAVVEALQSVFPLRRCTARLGRRFQPQPTAITCTPAQLGVAMCPCAGTADANHYATVVANTVQAMTTSPELVIVALQARLATLSADASIRGGRAGPRSGDGILQRDSAPATDRSAP